MTILYAIAMCVCIACVIVATMLTVIDREPTAFGFHFTVPRIITIALVAFVVALFIQVGQCR